MRIWKIAILSHKNEYAIFWISFLENSFIEVYNNKHCQIATG